MQPAIAETWFKWLLRLDGALVSLGLLAVFFPDTLMAWIHARLGLGEMPSDPITEYLARSCSLLYGIHGLLMLYVAVEPRRYWQLAWLLAGFHIVLGVVLLGIDMAAGMPWYWTCAEGPPIFSLGVALMVLWQIATRGRAGSSTS
jgi:hypothetical protein